MELILLSMHCPYITQGKSIALEIHQNNEVNLLFCSAGSSWFFSLSREPHKATQVLASHSVSRVGCNNVTLHRQLSYTRLTSCFRPHYHGRGVPPQTRLASRYLTWFHDFHFVISTQQGKAAAMQYSICSLAVCKSTSSTIEN